MLKNKFAPQNFHPKKSLGQNFLINPRIIENMMRTADLSGAETVIEIGPGFGILTETLIKRAKNVIAIEKDKKLFEFLKKKFAGAPNLKLIHADALRVPPPRSGAPYLLISNIPYSITSPLLDHFIRKNSHNLPKAAVLLVQKEVGQKICAKPPRMNVLALHVQTFGTPKLITAVSKNNFRPKPKVDSAIIKIDFFEESPPFDIEHYFNIIHRGFSQKRKMLRAMFSQNLLQKAGIKPTERPETLSKADWAKLALIDDVKE